jgi:Tfp pilus assembly PilM family ATPase
MGIFTSETSYFGLDIGSTAIRFVQLKKGGSNPVLVNFGEIFLVIFILIFVYMKRIAGLNN